MRRAVLRVEYDRKAKMAFRRNRITENLERPLSPHPKDLRETHTFIERITFTERAIFQWNGVSVGSSPSGGVT